MNTAFPSPEFEKWEECEELILSATAAYEQINQFGIDTESASLLLHQVAFYFFKQKAKYEESYLLYQKSLIIREKIFGENKKVFTFALPFNEMGD